MNLHSDAMQCATFFGVPYYKFTLCCREEEKPEERVAISQALFLSRDVFIECSEMCSVVC